jgi:hypothetical protein
MPEGATFRWELLKLNAYQTQPIREGYVRGEYIGTSECLTSSELCGTQLNRTMGSKPVL